jgi:hypothetical protein
MIRKEQHSTNKSRIMSEELHLRPVANSWCRALWWSPSQPSSATSHIVLFMVVERTPAIVLAILLRLFRDKQSKRHGAA